MNRFHVIAVNPEIGVVSEIMFEPDKGRTGRVYARPQKDTRHQYVINLSRDQTLLGFDTLADAQFAAKELCSRNQGISYIVCESLSVYCVAPGEVITKQFNEKGLVPV
jgi:hypothetical protein